MNIKKLLSAFFAIVLIISALSAVCAEEAGLLISPAPTAEGSGFSDVPADADYLEGLQKLVEYGIISGYPDGTFRPEEGVTRAEMCKMINLALGYTDIKGAAGFPDVTSENWYYVYALAAQKEEYIKGYEDGTFRGNEHITRQEVCTILVRLLKPMDLELPVNITDKVDEWAKPYVELIVMNYIMPLEEGDTFRATEKLKRHELATVLSNLAIGPVEELNADVRFFVNGVQYGETQVVSIGKSAEVPSDPTSNDPALVFDGWRVMGTNEVITINGVIVTGDVDYEAVFKKATHRVNFNVRGSSYDFEIVTHGKTVHAPTNPELKGYTFMGWSTEDGGEVIKLSETPIVKEMTLYAVFKKDDEIEQPPVVTPDPDTDPEYTVSFFVNGDIYATQKVKKNSSPTSPENPTRDGYEFKGWSTSSGGNVVELSALNITKNTTLYAVFEEKAPPPPAEYTVKFYVDGNVYDSQSVVENNSPNSPAEPTKEGYIFKGWTNTEGGTSLVVLGYFKVNADASFYAVFEEKAPEIKYFTVEFMVDGRVYSSSSIEDGKTSSAPAAPTKEGYTFNGWSKTEGGSTVNLSSVSITENTKFYAVFEKDIVIVYYDVNFYVDGNSVKNEKVEENKYVTTLPANPEKSGYEFIGWSLTDGGAITNVSAVAITNNTNFYAVFEKKPEKFTVKYTVEGSEYASYIVEAGDYPSVPNDPTKEGYEFLGWKSSETSSIVHPDKIAVNADIIYSAEFEYIPPVIIYFDVKFKVYGETVATDEIAEGGFAIAPDVDDANFKGWALSETEDENDAVDVATYEITEDTVFYAIIVTPPEPPKENDPELIEKMTRGLTQLKRIRLSNAKHKEAINVIASCVSKVLADANNGIYIDKSYVRSVYSSDVDAAKRIIKEEMTADERSNFVLIVTDERNMDKDVKEFLIDYFDISTSIYSK